MNFKHSVFRSMELKSSIGVIKIDQTGYVSNPKKFRVTNAEFLKHIGFILELEDESPNIKKEIKTVSKSG